MTLSSFARCHGAQHRRCSASLATGSEGHFATLELTVNVDRICLSTAT